MGKRVLLVHPLRQDYWFSDTPHVGLAQLAAVLTKAGHEVQVIDYVLWGKHHPSTDDVVALADAFQPEVIGLSMYTAVQSKTFELIDALSKFDAPILVGGPHCSINYDRLRLDDRLDYIFKGEAEATIVDVVAAAERQPFPLVVETRPFEIDELPPPDFSTFVHHQNMTAYPLITSRGCQFQCNFCVVSHVTNKQWRPRHVDLVVDECGTRIPRYPNVRSVVIADDNPLSDRRRFKEFLRRYAGLELGKLLSIANIRADTLDLEMLELMKPANCQAICLGVESGDPEVFKHVNKGEDLATIRHAAGLIKDAGLSLGMCFVIGLPHDTWELHQNSVAFAKEFDPDYIYWNVMHPMKGTDAHHYFTQRGATIQDDTDYTSLSDLTWETNEPLVDTPEFTKWERKKARFYAVVETDQYIPYPHLLGQFTARAREYDLVEVAVASLTRMRAKHLEIAAHVDAAIAELERAPAPAAQPPTSDAVPVVAADAVAAVPAAPNGPAANGSAAQTARPDASGPSGPKQPTAAPAPIDTWLRTRLLTKTAGPQSHLQRFFAMYPQLPALALWRAIEAEALGSVDIEDPILDLGCGDGTFMQVALGGRRIACGLDVESVNFPKARTLGIYDRLETYDGGTLPFADGSFRTIVANSVLEHVDEIDALLRQCRRVLAPGGRLVLTVPVAGYDDLLYFAQLGRADGNAAAADEHIAYHRASSRHLNWWPAADWTQHLRAAGFDVTPERPYVRQAGAWVFDILKTLGDQGVWQQEPASGAPGLKARFDRLALERLLDELVAAERDADGPAAAVLLEARAGVPATANAPGGDAPAIRRGASIFDAAEPFTKADADPSAYAARHANLTRDGLEHVACYLCGADDPQPVGTKEDLQVVSCGRCGFYYVNPRIPADKLAELYDRSYWFERMKLHGYPDVVRRAGHDYRLAVQRWELIGEKISAGSFLDIGCSNGAMLQRAGELGFTATGIELDHDIGEIAREATGRPVFEGPLREQRFARGEFDVITMHDVFEHLYDPRPELDELRRVLAPDGLLVIETFRRDCPQFEAGTPDMSHDDIKPGEHIYMYRQAEIVQLLSAARLRVEAVGYPDGDRNSRLLLHVRHAPAPSPPHRAAATSGSRKQRQRRKTRRARQSGARVSVIIPTYNRAGVLARTLAAYAEQTTAPHEVIVVDDGSVDATAKVARDARGLNLIYLRQANAGPAAARNAALARAAGDLVLITGDDIIPAPDLVARHLAAHAAAADPHVAIVGRIEWSDEQRVSYFMDYVTGAGGQQFNFRELDRLDRENLPAGWFLTSNISLDRAWLESSGERFDERFPYAAYEDLELGIRLQEQHGLRITYAADAVAYHLHPQTYAGFSARQQRAGEAAAILVEMRPEFEAHFVRGDLHERLAEIDATLPAHETAIAEFQRRLDRGERLPAAEQTLLNAHYAAALDAHQLRGFAAGAGADAASGERLTLAVISLNQRDQFDACLAAIRRHTPEPYDLVLVDTGSNEREPVAAGDGVRVMHDAAQRSRAWAINRAFERRRGNIVILDAGARVTDGWLSAMRTAASAESVGLVGPMSDYAACAHLGDPGAPSADAGRALARLGAFCLFVKGAVVEAIAGFDEGYVHDGPFAAWDFCLRARRAGFQAVVAPQAQVTWSGQHRSIGAGVKHADVMRESWTRFVSAWGLDPGTPIGDASALDSIAPAAAEAPTVFVAAPNWSDANSAWRMLVQVFATGFEAQRLVELHLLVDRTRGFSLDGVVADVQALIANLDVDPTDAPVLELVDDFRWVDGAPDVFRTADVFVMTEPELSAMRGDYIERAEAAGLPVIRKAEMGDLYVQAAVASDLPIVRDPTWEALEAARLTSQVRQTRHPIATY